MIERALRHIKEIVRLYQARAAQRFLTGVERMGQGVGVIACRIRSAWSMSSQKMIVFP